MADIAEAVAAAIRGAEHVDEDQSPGIRLRGQLPSGVYVAVDRLLSAAGGTWQRRAKLHLFPKGTNTRRAVEAALDASAWKLENPHDFFPTPADVADDAVESALDEDLLHLLNNSPKRRLRVLEPSAGTASMLDALCRRVPRERLDIVAFEIDEGRHRDLNARGYPVAGTDFLAAPVGAPVDLILTNPPYSAPRTPDAWLVHTNRALAWLRPGGVLAAVLPASFSNLLPQRSRDLPGRLEFKAKLNAWGTEEEIRRGAFQTSGRRTPSTAIDTVLACLTLPEAPDWRLRPCNGWSNWYTWQTALVVSNNNTAALERLTGWPGPLPSITRIREALVESRATWIGAGAAWLSEHVDAGEIAHVMAHRQEDEAEPLVETDALAATSADTLYGSATSPRRGQPHQLDLFATA